MLKQNILLLISISVRICASESVSEKSFSSPKVREIEVTDWDNLSETQTVDSDTIMTNALSANETIELPADISPIQDYIEIEYTYAKNPDINNNKILLINDYHETQSMEISHDNIRQTFTDLNSSIENQMAVLNAYRDKQAITDTDHVLDTMLATVEHMPSYSTMTEEDILTHARLLTEVFRELEICRKQFIAQNQMFAMKFIARLKQELFNIFALHAKR